MKEWESGSSEDLTIILPRSSMCAFLKSSSRRSSVIERSPRSRQEKVECISSKSHSAVPRAVRTSMVLVLVLAITVTAAGWKASRATPHGVERMASSGVGRNDLADQSPVSPAVPHGPSQSCSGRTTHSTAVNFLPNPTEATNEARKSTKLTFLLHISGNFEDPDFT